MLVGKAIMILPIQKTNITFGVSVKADNGKKITSGNYIVKIIYKTISLRSIFDSELKPLIPLPIINLPLSKAQSAILVPNYPKKLKDLTIFAG